MSLQRYVDQLCEDIRAHKSVFPFQPNLTSALVDPGISSAMQMSLHFSYGPQYTMADWFDIGGEQFPPSGQLSRGQQEQIGRAILELWRSLHMEAELPAGMPLFLAYPIFVQYWTAEEICILPAGTTHLEFCQYEPAHCPWPSVYCTCRAWQAEGTI